ncbi:hypothetical protein J5N97_010864 [Dioscorea zingiberensis]|uniref:Uncharacterized protein n=1 Tax=Dioscorea zingiberensis TaxID=325984 RepID=A0A9D5HMY9_9LILI|nr:hypothetical protein J5N97_010864 [Dioscorea zingiberensis]
MENSSCMGLVAVLAVSSSVALVAVQFHKRLLSDLMKKLHLELDFGYKTPMTKKKVRFAADVVEPSSNNEEFRRRQRGSRPPRRHNAPPSPTRRWVYIH